MESKGPTQTESVDALIVGAGFAGLYTVSYTHLTLPTILLV